jgi:hypothetical protein
MRRNNEKRICDWKFIRTHKMIDVKKKITEQYKIPSNTVDGAFMDICRNFKSCLSNLKNKNIKHFNLRYDNNKIKDFVIILELIIIEDYY